MARRRILKNKLRDPLTKHLRRFKRELSRDNVKTLKAGMADESLMAKVESEVEDSMDNDVRGFASFALDNGGERPILNWLWSHRSEIWAIFSRLFGVSGLPV